MLKEFTPRLEILEDRSLPTASAGLWPDATHLTLSFVPDGTNVGGAGSNLFSTLNAQLGSAAGWQQTIVKAFQTWAAQSNLNIAVTADDGDALGTPGQLQGDPGFGDIRIAAAPLSSSAVSTDAPPSAAAGSWSGDLIFNSNYSFGSGTGQYDLYTLALHEAGHAFGLPDTTSDPTSAMYASYTGVRTAPSANDIAQLQANYGARTPGVYEARSGSTSFANAYALSPTATTPVVFSANLSVLGNADYYSFQVDSGTHPGGVNVQLQTAHLSSLTARVSVYTSQGQLVATGATTNPFNGSVNLNLSRVTAGGTYYVVVQGASGSVFDVGSYQLAVNLHPLTPPSLGSNLMDDAQNLGSQENNGGNNSQGNNGGNNSSSGPLVSYGTINASNTSAVYQFQAPANATGGANFYLAAWGVGIVSPSLSLFDGNGKYLAATNAPDPNGVLTLNLSGITPNGTYYVEVASGVGNAAGLGNYRLEADLNQTGGPVSTQAMTLLANAAAQANTTASAATQLKNMTGTHTTAKYEVVDTLSAAGKVNYYQLKAPRTEAPNLMTLTVLAQDCNLRPLVTVTDSSGNVQTATVLANANGTFAVQVPNLGSNQQYLLAISPDPYGSAVGNFFLNVDFQAAATALQPFASDTLAPTQSQQFRTLTIGLNALYSFSLSAATASSAPAMQVQMLIYDASGNLIYTQYADAGQPATTGTGYLAGGTYTVQLIAVGQAAGQAAALTYNWSGQALSEPIGPVAYDSSGNQILTPPTNPNGPVYTLGGGSTTPTGAVTPYLNPLFYTY